MKNVYVVIGANFGDEGKGLVTNAIAESNPSRPTLVVMFNGGAQRGHTVYSKNKRRHVFHHLGAGTFANAATYMNKNFIVNPIIFRQEYESLNLSHYPSIYIDEQCLMTTLYDMFINQMLEEKRGASRHGSCGMGIYETLLRNRERTFLSSNKTFSYLPAESMTIGEFNKLSYLGKYNYLDYIRKNYLDKRLNDFGLLDKQESSYKAIISDCAIKNFIEDFEWVMKRTIVCSQEEVYNKYVNIIFEGAQGLLLDKDNMDYFPHLTPSNTGLRGCIEDINYINRIAQTEVSVYYVSRTYMTRHGAGRFDTECSKDMINSNMTDPTNVPNPFQGSLRYGKLDTMDLVKRVQKDYAILNENHNISKQINLVLTHWNEYKVDTRKFIPEFNDFYLSVNPFEIIRLKSH